MKENLISSIHMHMDSNPFEDRQMATNKHLRDMPAILRYVERDKQNIKRYRYPCNRPWKPLGL
jgi:hypothetical protein